MPLYTWHCEETDEEIDVLRSVDEYLAPPNEDELEKLIATTEHTWKKLVGFNVSKKLTNAWGFGKGYYGSRTPGNGRQ